jgi:uncharacterized protein YeaO (DUF488 family)
MNQEVANNRIHIKIAICRVYELPTHKEGIWVLVDRLWPRGIKKDDLTIDLWLKEIAPSTSLRKWFNHDPAKWFDFAQRYMKELQGKQALIECILEKANHSPITLLYAAKDTQHNHALVLQAVLQSWPKFPKFNG